MARAPEEVLTNSINLLSRKKARMLRKYWTLSGLLLVIGFFWVTTAAAAEKEEKPGAAIGASDSETGKVLRFPPSFAGPIYDVKVGLGGWLSTLEGDVTIQGRSGSLNEGLGGFGTVELHFEAWKGDLGFLLETLYTYGTADTGPADYTLERFGQEWAVGWRLAKLALGDGQGSLPGKRERALTFDLLIGGRYTWIRNKLAFSGPLGLTFEKTTNFVDLMVGGRMKWDPFERLSLMMRGDAAGFGIGSSSILSWNFKALLSYRLWRSLFIEPGVRVFGRRWNSGNVKTDLTSVGPEIFFRWRF